MSISIIILLLAILLPVLASTRQAATDLHCTATIRNAAAALFVYAADSDDAIVFLPPERTAVRLGPFDGVSIGGPAIRERGSWAALADTDGWSPAGASEALRCPSQPDHDPQAAGTALTEGALLFPQYALSAALEIDPSQLSIDDDTLPDAEWTDLRLRAHRLGDVRYPAAKALLWEAMAFCQGHDPEAAFFLELGHTFLFESSVARVDGSVVRAVPNDHGPTSLGAGLEMTRWGINGWDFGR
ncbi:MAG: hypothetical protein AAGF47_03935 [Planctomycetota bacterium]